MKINRESWEPQSLTRNIYNLKWTEEGLNVNTV